jgi:hypothetical protein
MHIHLQTETEIETESSTMMRGRKDVKLWIVCSPKREEDEMRARRQKKKPPPPPPPPPPESKAFDNAESADALLSTESRHAASDETPEEKTRDKGRNSR